jgi:hypothetical protein
LKNGTVSEYETVLVIEECAYDKGKEYLEEHFHPSRNTFIAVAAKLLNIIDEAIPPNERRRNNNTIL